MDEPATPSEHLFVVRIWQEPGQRNAASIWRGSVQHVTSGQRLYFASLRDMNDFITLKTGLPPLLEDERGVALPDPDAET